MARLAKTGLEYFPCDVDFLSGRKMRRLMRKHGSVAAVVIMSALTTTYGDKGYYMEWNEDVCFDMGEQANVDYEKVHAVIRDALEHGIFSKEMFKEHGVLTSENIQRQYLLCTLKRKKVELKYCLIKEAVPETLFSGEEMAVSGEEMPEIVPEMQQSKVKESKVNQSKSPHTPPVPGEERVMVEGFMVPRYALNKATHNCDGLIIRLIQIHVTERKHIEQILRATDYGRIGHFVWKVISHSNWPRTGIKFPGKYVLSQMPRDY